MFHITQSTAHTIPHTQLFHTTPTFNIIAHFTPHHIPYHVTPPHLDFTSHHHIWHHNTLHHFHICHHTTITQHIAYATFFITTIPHNYISHPVISFHILHYVILHMPGHHSPHHAIVHITQFAFQSHSSTLHHVWNCNIPHRTIFHIHITPHFTSHHNSHQITSRLTIPHHAHIPPHITPTFHLTSRHAHHHIQI